MHGRTKRGTIALGAMTVASLAATEAADARPVDDSGAPAPTTTSTPDPTPAEPKAPVSRAPSRSYGDEHRQPRSQPEEPVQPVLDPVQRQLKTKPRPKPANRTISTEEPPARSYGDEHREPRLQPEEPVQPVLDPVQRQLKTKPRPRRVDPTPPADEPPSRSYGDDRRQPLLQPAGGHPTRPDGAGPVEPTSGQPPTSYADDRRTPLPTTVQDPEPETETEGDPDPEPLTGTAKTMKGSGDDDDGGGFSIGIKVNLPGDRFDVNASTPAIDPWDVVDPNDRVSPEVRDAVDHTVRTTADNVHDAGVATRKWLDEKPTCVGGTFYRYGGGGGELCVDTATGESSWSAQGGAGTGGSVKVHRPDALPTERYCGVGGTVSSPTVFGRYERRYNFGTGEWYNDYDWGVSVPYKTNKYLPVDGASSGPSKGKHVAPRGQRGPASTSTPRHRAPFSPLKAGSNLAKPSSAAVYGTCGGPGPDLWD